MTTKPNSVTGDDDSKEARVRDLRERERERERERFFFETNKG